MKRAMDLVLVVVTAPLWIPLVLVVALFVRVKIGKSVIFTQTRPGLHGRLFRLRKFRTMTDACDPDGHLCSDAERITAFGRWLRATSLDELPELWNVVCGEMSLVGPRPLLTEYLARYDAVQARRHDVLPGITGWAQVNGRNAIAWDEKFRLDVWYVDHRSLLLDLQILCLTLRRVIHRHGISAEGEATISKFVGNAQ